MKSAVLAGLTEDHKNSLVIHLYGSGLPKVHKLEIHG